MPGAPAGVRRRPLAHERREQGNGRAGPADLGRGGGRASPREPPGREPPQHRQPRRLGHRLRTKAPGGRARALPLPLPLSLPLPAGGAQCPAGHPSTRSHTYRPARDLGGVRVEDETASRGPEFKSTRVRLQGRDQHRNRAPRTAALLPERSEAAASPARPRS